MEKRKYKDRVDDIKKAVAKRRKMIKQMAIKHKGGKCCIFGYSKCNSALDFHHREESNKSFGLAVRGLTRSWERTRKELNKCILVCANCHREIHEGITQPPKETSG